MAEWANPCLCTKVCQGPQNWSNHQTKEPKPNGAIFEPLPWLWVSLNPTAAAIDHIQERSLMTEYTGLVFSVVCVLTHVEGMKGANSVDVTVLSCFPSSHNKGSNWLLLSAVTPCRSVRTHCGNPTLIAHSSLAVWPCRRPMSGLWRPCTNAAFVWFIFLGAQWITWLLRLSSSENGFDRKPVQRLMLSITVSVFNGVTKQKYRAYCLQDTWKTSYSVCLCVFNHQVSKLSVQFHPKNASMLRMRYQTNFGLEAS